LFSELTSKGTKDFLKSLPISKTNILTGKLITVLTVFLASYGIIELISLVIGLYGKGNASTRLVFILFYILMCSAMLSIFCFVSVAVKNKWTALGINYGISVLCSLFCVFRDDMPNVLESILEPFSIIGAFNNAPYGVFDLASIILWVSVIGIFGALTYVFFNKEFDN
jgi:ABC-type transport system involved in multi-copper enzyme maturation permease subunit